MKLLSLCLGLTLVWAHEEGNHEVVTSNIDLSKISGDWYTVLLASDDKERIDENGDLRIFVEHIQALDSSSVLLRYHTKKNGQCTEFSIVGEDTDQDGVYSVFYEGHNRFSIIEAVYGEYAICHTVNFNNGKITQVMELFGHEPDLNDQIKRRFKEICQKYEVHHILDLNNVALTSDLQIELSDLPVVSQLGKWPLSFPIVSYLRCIVGLHSADVWEGCSHYGCVTAE